MKYKAGICTALVSFTLVSCGSGTESRQVISQRYIHKYGYDVSRDEWESQQHPGQVLTTLRDGKTIAESYEEGILHGPRSETFPHSQTIQTLEQYERGRITKRTTYTIRGVPQKEEEFKAPTHVMATLWYASGSPKAKEEYKDSILINGQYFTASNEIDSRVESGTGERTNRNASGDLLSKEVFNNYAVTYHETYYPNNSPHTTTSYENGLIHGDRKVFAMSGEPIAIESYFKGRRQGLCTYYQNGYKFLEVAYEGGLKNGMEKHYIDGEIVTEETEFKDSLKHGCSVIYCDGSARTTWYFDDFKVTKSKFEELTLRTDVIMGVAK